MPIDVELLSHFERVNERDIALLIHLEDRGELATVTTTALLQALVVARFDLARQFYRFADRLPAADDIDRRNKVSRAYYVLHHGVRALILWFDQQECPDHARAVQRMAAIGRHLGTTDPARRQAYEQVANDLQFWKTIREQCDYNPSLPAAFNLPAQANRALRAAWDFLTWAEAELHLEGVI